jgi:hypothetical protein
VLGWFGKHSGAFIFAHICGIVAGYLYIGLAGIGAAPVRKTPSWPRSRANLSLLYLCFHRNA